MNAVSSRVTSFGYDDVRASRTKPPLEGRAAAENASLITRSALDLRQTATAEAKGGGRGTKQFSQSLDVTGFFATVLCSAGVGQYSHGVMCDGMVTSRCSSHKVCGGEGCSHTTAAQKYSSSKEQHAVWGTDFNYNKQL